MIKHLLVFISCALTYSISAQTADDKLIAVIRGFHQSLVAKNIVSINQQTDKALSYGHSNGWVETKTEFLRNIETGIMRYESYKEDSLVINSNGNLANARFTADISGTLNGKNNQYLLRVLEVWVKKGNRWVLFARQAVRK